MAEKPRKKNYAYRHFKNDSNNISLKIPENFTLYETQDIIPKEKVEPKIHIKCDTFQCTHHQHFIDDAQAKDMPFVIKRDEDDVKEGWTHFNQKLSNSELEKSPFVYLPMILAPAHEYETLITVVQP